MPMPGLMSFALRHSISLVLVLAALASTAAVFAFARPQFQKPNESEMIDFSGRVYHSPDAVKAAFAAHGVELQIVSRFSGMITLSNESAPLQADALQVIVAPRSGRGSWGARLEPYDKRFDNLLVSYGGKDERLLAGVESAVSDLQ
jgi:hypothetical protein